MQTKASGKYFDTFGVMLDCSRGAVYKKETVEKFIDFLSAAGYNMLQLYTEDVYEVDGEPYFGYLRGRYSKEELKELDAYAASRGIELVPCIQTLAHLNGIARWSAYAEIIDVGDILFAGEDRVYELIDKMFRTCAECFTSRRINIGMDEAHMVGLGKYLDKHGYRNRFQILYDHLKKVIAIGEKYGFKPMMWSDMFFRLANKGQYYAEDPDLGQDVIDAVPENVGLVYWDYYSKEQSTYDKMIRAHKKFKNEVWFAGGAWAWAGNTPHNDFSIRTTELAIRSCIENGVRNAFITCWKDNGAESSIWGILPSLVWAAQCSRGDFDMENCKRVFREIVGESFDDFMLLDLPDRLSEEFRIITPAKYILYADPFMGVFDWHMRSEMEGKYKDFAARLAAKADMKEYGYVFRTLSDLCGFLSVKCTLGVHTRELYRKGDKKALRALAEKDYTAASEALARFYDSFEAQWRTESKENGFEAIDVRIGGQAARLKHCKKMLLDYCDGKISKIEPLEEEILPVHPGSEKGSDLSYNNWLQSAIINS